MTVQRAEMKQKVDAILTEEQRNSLASVNGARFGNHQMGGRHKKGGRHQMGGNQGW